MNPIFLPKKLRLRKDNLTRNFNLSKGHLLSKIHVL